MNKIYSNPNINKTFEPFVIVANREHSLSAAKEEKYSQQNDSYEKTEKQKKRINRLITIGTTATLAATAFIAIITGHSHKISKKIQSIFGGVESRFSKVQDKTQHKFLTSAFGLFDKLGKIATNSSSIKDYSLYLLLEKTKKTSRFSDYISRKFSKGNINSVNKSLIKARESHSNFVKSLQEAIEQSEANASLVKDKEKFTKLKELLIKVKDSSGFISDEHLTKLKTAMSEDMSYLAHEISLKRLLSKEAFQGFVPELILIKRRASYVKDILQQKNNISRSFSDIGKYAKNRLEDVNILIYSIKDSKLQQKLNQSSLDFAKNLKKYIKESPDRNTRDGNLALVQKSLADLKKEVNSLVHSDAKENLLLHIDEYENLFKDHNSGIIQDIRILAGDVWGDKSGFDLNIKKAAMQHSKDLNESSERMINMFDKERDITLGSGPSDVLGMLSPIALFALALNKADSKDEKVGVSLELGIPLLGGFLVYLKTLVLQYNGMKALTMSLGSGVLLNYAGSLIYKKYMEHQEELARKKEQEKESTPQQL